ncbi:MAG TPA: alanine racemase [Pseudacidobacterium sp.]|jgi:alanine racemase|nr:alanine racemase [Pseudacidobacterium sp.]
MKPSRPVWAEISRSRLLANWKLLREAAPRDAEVLAVLKANAYGHGALACHEILANAGACWFGVTCVEEGIALRNACADARILVMSGLWNSEADAIIEHRLTPQVWEPFHFDLLETAARERGLGPQSIPVHLEIDTGMSRQGVRSLDALRSLLERGNAASPIQIEGVMTHFSAPEVLEPDATQTQIAHFAAALELLRKLGIRPAYIHAGNSATLFVSQHLQALMELSEKHGARLMLRPGIALYGYPPRFTPQLSGKSASLQPVLAWKTRVVSLREINKGESAGYNMTFRAARQTRLALTPVGYADGLNRLLSNRGHALVHGKKAPIAGRVSMDQTILDVTDIPDIAIGDEVVLIGEQKNERMTAYDLADATGTIPYEVTCAIGARVPRLIVD